MSTEYQIVASTADRTAPDVEQLAAKLGDLFDVELSGLLEALSSTGVCVATAPNLQAARQLGAKIVAVGADFRVLDSRGAQIAAGQGKAAIEARTSPPRQEARTLIGGFDARALGLAMDAPKGAADEPMELDDPGGFAAADAHIAQGAVSFDTMPATEGMVVEQLTGGEAAENAPIAVDGLAVPDGPPETELESAASFMAMVGGKPDPTKSPAAVERDPGSGPALGQTAGAEPGGFNLDALSADSLVMLDGTADSTPDQSAAAFAKTSPMADSSFLPPDEGDQNLALELDDGEVKQAERAEPMQAPEVPTEPPKPELEQPAAPEAPPAPPPPPSVPLPEGAPPLPKAQPSSAFPDAEEYTRAKPSYTRPTPKVLALFGGRLQQWPRLRVLAGFVVALMLGSFFPTCNAHSVRDGRIEALRKDLSTAKAHGSLLASQSGYQSPEQIQAAIGSLQTRTTIYSVLMWMAISGLLLFLWFRFT